ncbi:hypothetical protein F1193_08465 [Blastochloris sulfoviridis]|uniref:Uncharacterized protein n=1 Tax=Blastochloris sulfoviridis TaxID=50712 RepID=A0A5M6I1A7_9HYPH|nr:hypothetical protein F1193_08465 [Blastochloris sulfoviridis]
MATALAAVLFGAAALGTAGPAQAWHPHPHHHHHGGHWHRGHGGAIAGGVAAGLLLGGIAAAAASNSYRECYLQDRFDRYGNYVRTVRVCR